MFSRGTEKLQKQVQNVQRIGFQERQKGVNMGLDKLDAAEEGCSKDGFYQQRKYSFFLGQKIIT